MVHHSWAKEKPDSLLTFLRPPCQPVWDLKSRGLQGSKGFVVVVVVVVVRLLLRLGAVMQYSAQIRQEMP